MLKLEVPVKLVIGIAEEVATVVLAIVIVELVFEGFVPLMLPPRIKVLASIHFRHKLLEKIPISFSYYSIH